MGSRHEVMTLIYSQTRVLLRSHDILLKFTLFFYQTRGEIIFKSQDPIILTNYLSSLLNLIGYNISHSQPQKEKVFLLRDFAYISLFVFTYEPGSLLGTMRKIFKCHHYVAIKVGLMRWVRAFIILNYNIITSYKI